MVSLSYDSAGGAFLDRHEIISDTSGSVSRPSPGSHGVGQ